MLLKESSVKDAEIRHFLKFSRTWWDEKGPYALLHRINPLRLTYIRDEIRHHFSLALSRHFLEGIRILDVGCGGGLLCEPLCRLGAEVVGIDACKENIETARDHAEMQDLKIVYATTALENFDDSSVPFDVILAFELLEHVEDPLFFLKTCFRFLRPGGLLLLSTLNRTFLSYALGILAAEYLLRWVPPGTHHWEQFITPHELDWMLKSSQFIPSAPQGLTFHPFTGTWHLSAQTEINYFISAVKPETALISS